MMRDTERIGENNEESERRCGHNVRIHAYYVRHAEKETSTSNPETGLSERGVVRASEFGEQLEPADVSKGYASRTDRTRDTASLSVDHSPSEKRYLVGPNREPRYRKELAFIYDPNGAFIKEALRIKAEILGEDYEKLPAEEKDERMREVERRQQALYLAYGDKRPDPQTFSPVESAALVAQRVEKNVHMADRLYDGSTVNLVNATHDFPLIAFLQQTLLRTIKGKRVRGFASVDEVGGPLGFTEGFELVLQNDENGGKHIALLFRGQRYVLDMTRVQELAQLARERHLLDAGQEDSL